MCARIIEGSRLSYRNANRVNIKMAINKRIVHELAHLVVQFLVIVVQFQYVEGIHCTDDAVSLYVASQTRNRFSRTMDVTICCITFSQVLWVIPNCCWSWEILFFVGTQKQSGLETREEMFTNN